MPEKKGSPVDTSTSLPFWKWFFISLGSLLKSLLIFLWELLKTIFYAFLNIFIGAWKGLVWLIKAIGRLAKRYFLYFKNGTWKTRLSFLFMGAGAIFNGQIIKGILLFVFQIGVVLFMATNGWNLIYMLRNLGSQIYIEGQWSDACSCYTTTIPADNSLLILLFGIATIMVIFAYFIFYNININIAHDNQMLIAQGKKPKTFKQDVSAFLNEKFHITVLSFPVLSAFAFTVLPLIFMIFLAFTNFDRLHQYPGSRFWWTGLTSFINLFSGTDSTYRLLPASLGRILGWTIIWAILATVLNYIFGMILALMINKKGIKLKKLWRTVFVITIAIPQFITLLIVSRLLSDTGPILAMLVKWGWVGTNFSFLTGNGTVARTTVVIVNLWVGVPYTMLITSGILMNIPADLYESAKIDGAGPVTQFFKITLPYMLFVTGPYLITAFIGNINNFNVIYFLTGGGPSDLTLFNAGKTDLLVTWLYKLTVNNQEYSIGSTLGIMVFVICSFVSLIMYSRTGAVQKEDEFQ